MKNIVLIASLLLLFGCNGGTNDSKLKNYPENIEFGSQGGTEQFAICIPEGYELIIPKDCTWVEVDYIQEAGDSTAWLTLIISENDRLSPRETTVTIRPKGLIGIGDIIKGRGGLSKRIKIKQQGVMIENICDLNMRMIFVKGGTFTMGTPGSNEEHLVTLDSFYIGETEITQAQWRAVMGSNPSEFVGDSHPVDHISSAALDLKGCSEPPTHVYLKLEDAATGCSLDCIISQDSPLLLQTADLTALLSPHSHKSTDNVPACPVPREDPGPTCSPHTKPCRLSNSLSSLLW